MLLSDPTPIHVVYSKYHAPVLENKCYCIAKLVSSGYKAFCSRCLQVGSFEGASALWFAEHLLQHPDSTLICLDTWEGGHDFGNERTPTLSAAMSDVEVC